MERVLEFNKKLKGNSMETQRNFEKKIKIPYFKRLKTKISISFLIISIVMITLLSSMLYLISSSIISKYMAQKATNIAKNSLEYIDVKAFQELKAVEDEQKDSYKAMREHLSYIRKISGSKYVYTMRKTEDGKFMYVVDGSEEENISHIGDTEDSDERYEAVWSGGIYIDNKMRDEGQWGILISSYYPIKDNDKVIGFVGVDYDAGDMYRALQRFRVLAIFISLGVSTIIAVCGLLTAGYVTKPIIKITNMSERVANNDLSVEDLDYKDSGELGILAVSFNKMVENIKDMVSMVQEYSVKLEASSHIIADSTQEIGASSEGIARTVQEIAAGSSNQAQEAATGYQLVNDLSMKVEEISNRVSLANVNTDKMKQKNEIGTSSIITLEKNFGQYLSSSLAVETKVEELSESSNSIKHILKTINTIAEQTNLLALNAAIEAARAGEHGKGFAVVSEEVRKLAEQASLSTKEIHVIVDDVSEGISNITKLTNTSKSLIYDVKTSIQTSKEALGDIGASVNDTINEIKYLDSDIKEVDNLRLKVLSAVESITAITQQSAAATEEISASAEEQSASMEEIVASIENLNDMISSFASTIKQYKL
jgi:methyl-accepting chemotaxis protein